MIRRRSRRRWNGCSTEACARPWESGRASTSLENFTVKAMAENYVTAIKSFGVRGTN